MEDEHSKVIDRKLASSLISASQQGFSDHEYIILPIWHIFEASLKPRNQVNHIKMLRKIFAIFTNNGNSFKETLWRDANNEFLYLSFIFLQI